jgi:RecB family exonuclease
LVPSSLDDHHDVPWLQELGGAAPQLLPTGVSHRHARREPARREHEAAGQHAELLKRAEVRDVLAWMRLLVEPRNAAAAVRALARPPIELRQVDLARVIQIVRRQRLDVVAALAGAMESPQLPPEARERIARFLELHRWASGGFDTVRADLFVGRLIERLGLRRRQLLAGDGEDAQRVAGLAGLSELAEEFVRSAPRPTARALAIHLGDEAERNGEPQAAAVKHAAPVESQTAESPAEAAAQAMLRMMREEVLGDVARIAGRLGELRLDTELDVSHGVVRYLELLKLAALAERAAGEPMEDALADLNARLRTAMTSLQREIYDSSPLDELLRDEHARGGRPGAAAGLDGGADGEVARTHAARAFAVAARDEPSLAAFLPRRGEGLVLSASDVETYRRCPLRYKYARVLKIPTEQTLQQRFGIVVHQVLERFHAAEVADGADRRSPGSLVELMDLLDAAWRRAGMGESAQERELLGKARAALARYHERLREEGAHPVWFERPFAFALGPHHVRGRVDRVDRLPGGGWELIDYKTGFAKTPEELGDDIQLSLYAIAAREAWDLGNTRQSYYYVLDDRKVAVPESADGGEGVREAVLGAGTGILAQSFEPTPSAAACAHCDYRIACPAAER